MCPDTSIASDTEHNSDTDCSTEADLAMPPPAQNAPWRLVLTTRTKWTVDVVEQVLSAADASAAKRATVAVLGRGAVREADEVFNALPGAKVHGIQHEWAFTLIDMRTGSGRMFVLPDGRFDPRYAIPPPPQPRNASPLGHSAAFECALLPWQLAAEVPSHIAICVVLIWLTRTKTGRLDNIPRLRIREERVLDDLNALLRGEAWPGKSVYLEPVPKKAVFIDGASLRGPKRARR